MLKVRIISRIFQPCKASTNNALEGDARALWLYALKREKAAIYVEWVALMSCSNYSFLSDKSTHSTSCATALISEASGVTQIYFGLSQGGLWPRQIRDRKTWRWESCSTWFSEYPWTADRMGIAQSLVQGPFKMTKDLELTPYGLEGHFSLISLIICVFRIIIVFPALPFISV